MAHPSNAVAAALEAVRQTTAAQVATIDAFEHAFDAEMALLASDRQALKDDRAAFLKETDEMVAREEELRQRMRAAAPPPDDLVKLNMGGAPFKMTRAVLTKADPLDGSIFIDLLRRAVRHAPRLSARRSSRRPAYAGSDPLPEAAQVALVQELDYFGLEAAVFGGRP